MQIEIPDELLLDALREAFTPAVERLIDEKVEQRRPLLLSITQVAEELSCSRGSVYSLVHGGSLEAIRTGRTYRVATVTFQEYVDELTKPTREREVVSARSRPSPARRTATSSQRVRSRQPTATSVVEAPRPPRSPRLKKRKISKQEIAEERCTIAKFADRWWGIESAKALLDQSGVVFTEGSDGEMTFRYGDLIEWMEHNEAAFHQWAEEFDPVLNGGVRK
jgi:excisionase family DNA binding protein